VHTDDSEEIKQAKKIFEMARAEDIAVTGESKADIKSEAARP
jgi:hypothetical protein